MMGTSCIYIGSPCPFAIAPERRAPCESTAYKNSSGKVPIPVVKRSPPKFSGQLFNGEIRDLRVAKRHHITAHNLNTPMLPTLTIRPISESDIDEIVKAAGGIRAHEDAHRRAKKGADYRLKDAVIELKILEEDGLLKPERRAKLAELFKQVTPDRPVIVLDKNKLPGSLQRYYNRILEGPIKTAVSKARVQLSQSRTELDGTNASILMVINNGYTALRHEELMAMVAHRVRQDTSEIDGLVVGGCYYYSDGFDSFYIWPLEYLPINVSKFFDFEVLLAAWNSFSEQFMTQLMQSPPGKTSTKGPVIDQQFDVGGTTFLMPTPRIGEPSSFYHRGRPRQNSSGIDICPKVAVVRAEIGKDDWSKFQTALESLAWESHQQWQNRLAQQSNAENGLQPVVAMPINFDDWVAWLERQNLTPSMQSIHAFATDLFERAVRDVMERSIEWSENCVLPARYVLLITDEIGQDKANDISRIAIARSRPEVEQPQIFPILENARIFFEHALALASAYAVRERIDYVIWHRNLEYGWY